MGFFMRVHSCLSAQFALVGTLLSVVSVVSVDLPRPGRDIVLEPEAVTIHATVTAYSSSPDETWGDPFITASGRRVFDGLVACPRTFPFGTKFKIGRRTYSCYDRLHKKYDDRFDIWMSTKDAALEFGRRQVPVELLEG
jgi:3D (Asp-Asp-Asp) domain-containing protein